MPTNTHPDCHTPNQPVHSTHRSKVKCDRKGPVCGRCVRDACLVIVAPSTPLKKSEGPQAIHPSIHPSKHG